MTHGEMERRLAELERRVAAMAPRLPSGVMVSTVNGAAEVRPFQVGFPARITSTYGGAGVGYSWERLALLPPPGSDVRADAVPQTGGKLFEVNNSTALAVNDRVWVEPDPQSRGYLCRVYPPAALTNSFVNNIGATTLSADNTYAALSTGGSPITFTLADAGTYLISATVSARGSISAAPTAGHGGTILARFRGLSGISASATSRWAVLCVQVPNLIVTGSATWTGLVTASAGATFQVEGARIKGGLETFAWTTAEFGTVVLDGSLDPVNAVVTRVKIA